MTVKAQPGSVGTRWMFDNLKPGMALKAFGPLGDFSYAKYPGKKYLFISAGSGITPMMSMTRDLSDRAPDSDITFLNCARSPDDIIFRWELEAKARDMLKAHAKDVSKAEKAIASLDATRAELADRRAKALARLRLATVLMDAKAYDEALKQLSGPFAAEYAAVVADRKGDVLVKDDEQPLTANLENVTLTGAANLAATGNAGKAGAEQGFARLRRMTTSDLHLLLHLE